MSIRTLRWKVRRDPTDGASWRALAEALREDGQTAEAIKAARKAWGCELPPSDAAGLALLLEALGDSTSAEELALRVETQSREPAEAPAAEEAEATPSENGEASDADAPAVEDGVEEEAAAAEDADAAENAAPATEQAEAEPPAAEDAENAEAATASPPAKKRQQKEARPKRADGDSEPADGPGAEAHPAPDATVETAPVPSNPDDTEVGLPPAQQPDPQPEHTLELPPADAGPAKPEPTPLPITEDGLPVLEGDMAHVPLPALLDILRVNRCRGLLHLEGPAGSAWLALEDGVLLAAMEGEQTDTLPDAVGDLVEMVATLGARPAGEGRYRFEPAARAAEVPRDAIDAGTGLPLDAALLTMAGAGGAA